MAGQIIIVNGTSGAGKSTTCEIFAKRRQDFWLLFGIDHFLSSSFPARYSHHGPDARQGIYAHPVDEGVPEGTLRWSFGDCGTPPRRCATSSSSGWPKGRERPSRFSAGAP